MADISLKPGEANCGLCQKAPKTGNSSCPIKPLQVARARLDKHDCLHYSPHSTRQRINKQLREESIHVQENLF